MSAVSKTMSGDLSRGLSMNPQIAYAANQSVNVNNDVTVMVGNEQFKGYIVKTASNGISNMPKKIYIGKRRKICLILSMEELQLIHLKLRFQNVRIFRHRKKRYKSISIPGRSGDLIEADGEYEDIEIPIKMNFIADPEEGGMKYRKIKKWLLSGANVACVFRRCKCFL